MKKWNYLFIAMGCTLIILNGCKKDENKTETPTPTVTTVTDIDGNIYKTVTIGTQVWMAENLKVTHYRNGDPIAHVTEDNQWGNLTSGAYCNYDNISANAATYGRLYNWYAVADGPLLSPLGWHIPSEAEFETLATYLGGNSIAGCKLKETGIAHWISPNTGATNESGFTALPSGYRTYTGSAFNFMGSYCYWWSSEENGNGYAIFYGLAYNYTDFVHNTVYKNYGYSVRCIKDN